MANNDYLNKIEVRTGSVCFPIRGNQVLLFKIQYGENDLKWNGIGGWVEVGETLEGGLQREIQEEIGIIIDLKKLHKKLVLKDQLGEGKDLVVFTLEVEEFEPRITDTSIKEYKWFDRNNVPFDQMWPGNEKWLPNVIRND